MGAIMNCLSKKYQMHYLTAALILLFVFVFSLASINSADAYTITITTNRTVVNDLSIGGDVNSAPSGIVCTDGTSGVCSYLFTDGIQITLAANPNWKSNFVGWGTPCTGSGTDSCVFTPTADTTVNATFSPNYQATVMGHLAQYTTLTEAYANASDQSNVAAHIYTFYENLTLDQPIFIRFYGGREGVEYLTHIGTDFTTLQGTLDVQQGSVEIDSLIIQ